MSALDWPGLMRAGLHALRLTPRDFWALTPAELRVMLGAETRATMSRARLKELAEQWPDAASGQKGAGDGHIGY